MKNKNVVIRMSPYEIPFMKSGAVDEEASVMQVELVNWKLALFGAVPSSGINAPAELLNQTGFEYEHVVVDISIVIYAVCLACCANSITNARRQVKRKPKQNKNIILSSKYYEINCGLCQKKKRKGGFLPLIAIDWILWIVEKKRLESTAIQIRRARGKPPFKRSPTRKNPFSRLSHLYLNRSVLKRTQFKVMPPKALPFFFTKC